MKRYKKHSTKINLIFTLGIFLAIITIASIAFFSSNNSSSSNVFLECESTKNTASRLNCYNDGALYSLQNGGSIVELYQFAREAPGNQHRKEHTIGRAVLILHDYNLESVLKECKPDSCTFGFYHGLTEEWGKYDPSRTAEFENFVNDFCNFEGTERRDCYHTLGHYYFYTSPDKNFEKGLETCNNLKNDMDLFWCSYGVIHQYFFESDDEKLLGFFDRCADYTDRRAAVCYANGSFRYSKRPRGQKDIETAIKRCEVLTAKIPVEFNHCYDGVKMWFFESGGVVSASELCEAVDTNFRELCINGLTSSWPEGAEGKTF